jgi:nitroimidazol reductase NimA-like FMN-containing flavoprotein (pyridoxamine 5'-phosphate oxidase superfamily)
MIGLLSAEEMDSMLRRNRVGRLACSSNDRPYVVPINYGYDGEHIYSYSANGRKIATMREQPLVCFEIDEIDGPSNWESVVIEGIYEELTEQVERENAKSLLVKTGEGPVLRTMSSAADERIVYFRIRVDERSGRYERRDD